MVPRARAAGYAVRAPGRLCVAHGDAGAAQGVERRGAADGHLHAGPGPERRGAAPEARVALARGHRVGHGVGDLPRARREQQRRDDRRHVAQGRRRPARERLGHPRAEL